MTNHFVGRKNELETFKRCLSSQQQNGVYYYGPAGIGKSKLLKKIVDVCTEELECQAIFIDLFSTQNRSIEGIQNTIIKHLDASEAFDEIFEIRRQIEQVRQNASFLHKTERILSYKRQIDVLFPHSCNKAADKRRIVLIFDSFEYIQQRDIGRWFIQDFLPHLLSDGKNGIIIVLAGRAEPEPAKTPLNIIQSPLNRFRPEEVREYVAEFELPWNEEELEAVYHVTKGIPLLIDLLRWRGSLELLHSLKSLKKPLDTPEVLAENIFDAEIRRPSPLNRVLWAMATLKRRFDIDMLEYLVMNTKWLHEVNYKELQQELQRFPFVKLGEESSSHLLHDAVVAPICIVFDGVDGAKGLRENLFKTIVYDYYPRRIQKAHTVDEKMNLQAEQLGYIIEQNIDEGIDRYRNYLQEIQRENNYRFDEILWEEVYEQLSKYPERSINFMLEKTRWLYENGLYKGLERVSRCIYDMQHIRRENRFESSQFLGFALMRQGKLREAQQQFQRSLEIAKAFDSEFRIAETESYFAQVAIQAGRYDTATNHYWKAIQLYKHFDNPQKIAMTYSSFGYALAMKGEFLRALPHCRYALELFERYHDTRRYIYTLINMGIVHQFLHDYTSAFSYLGKAQQCAEQANLLELDAHVLRDMASTAYLQGKQAREEHHDYNTDCEEQGRSLEFLVNSLDKARNIGHHIQVSRSLILLANILEEISYLEKAKNMVEQENPDTSHFPTVQFEGLLEEIQDMGIVEDVYRFQQKLVHFPEKAFSELSLLQKMARLIEIGITEIPELNESYFMLENQVELARILLEIQAWSEVETRISLIRRTHPGIYNDNVLIAFCTLLQADLDFDRGDNKEAVLTGYAQAIPVIATVEGTPPHLIVRRIEELCKRLRALEDEEMACEWCRRLLDVWVKAGVMESFPLLIDRLQILLHELLEKLSVLQDLDKN